MTTLDARGLSVSAAGSVLIDQIDLTAAGGTITVVVGPNGAGKSTLLAALARLHGTGVVRFGDDDLDELSRRARAQRVAMIQQSTRTEVELTVRDAVTLGRTPHLGAWGDDPSPQVVADALDAVEMTAFADRALTSLSGGERQRVAIGMALAQQPQLLLVDEPSNHLDVAAQLSIMGLLRHLADQGATVVVALHDLALALEHSDAAVVLSHGLRIAAGPTRETLTEQLISDVYGVEARILTDPRSGRSALSFAPRGTQDSSAESERPVHAGSRSARPAS